LECFLTKRSEGRSVISVKKLLRSNSACQWRSQNFCGSENVKTNFFLKRGVIFLNQAPLPSAKPLLHEQLFVFYWKFNLFLILTQRIYWLSAIFADFKLFILLIFTSHIRCLSASYVSSNPGLIIKGTKAIFIWALALLFWGLPPMFIYQKIRPESGYILILFKGLWSKKLVKIEAKTSKGTQKHCLCHFLLLFWTVLRTNLQDLCWNIATDKTNLLIYEHRW